MASERHCLKIPFLIGQRDDTIIGNSCADSPVWEVPCADLDLGDHACSDLTLTAPTEKTLVLS